LLGKTLNSLKFISYSGLMAEGLGLSFSPSSIQSAVESAKSYLFSLAQKALAGEPTSIALIGLIAIILLVVFFKVSGWVYGLIKRIFLLLIILFSFYYFMVNYGARLLAEGTPFSLVIVGIVGIFCGVFAIISLYFSFRKHSRKRGLTEEELEQLEKEEAREVIREKIEEELKAGVVVAPEEIPKPKKEIPFAPTQLQQPQAMTKQGFSRSFSASLFASQLMNDRSLMAVISYVVVAEFGVFSGVTVAAPSVQVGMAFAVVFFLAAFVFIRTTYHNYVKGLAHLVIASIFGVSLSLILGHFWVNIPLKELLSLNYFKSIPLVAFITGIAVSLFMGSKN
jgi:TRAP-type C4-dicarboxylate transport system permease small subunit